MKAQILLKNLQWLGRHNPAFLPGSVQTAVAELLNPTSSILPYSGRLCLDKPAIVCTGTKYFNIDAGKTKNVNFQILMPTAEGTYPVHLDIFSNDQLLEAYRADEDVVVGLLKYTLKVTIEPPGAAYVEKLPSKATYSAGEVVTLIAHPYSGYEFDHWGGWPPYPGVGSTSDILKITMDADWLVVAACRWVAIEGFVLSIKNPPPAGTHWSATFFSEEEGKFISPMPAPTIGEIWNCPFNPYGATDLRVQVLDFVNRRTVHDQGNLGPIYSGKTYVYNCATRQLSEA